MLLGVVALGEEHVLRASKVGTKGTAVARPSEEVGHATWAGGRTDDVPILLSVPPLWACTDSSVCPLSTSSLSGGTQVTAIQHQSLTYCPHLEKNNCESSHPCISVVPSLFIFLPLAVDGKWVGETT